METEDNKNQIEEEEKYIKEIDKYDIYDEDFIPLNNYRQTIFKKTAIKQTKGKGKFIKKKDPRDCFNAYYCKCGKCMMNQIYSENFDKMNSISLFDYSSILKDYKKESKIFNDKNFFQFLINKNKFDVKLRYKASENKFSIKNLVKINNNNKSKMNIGQLIVIKFSNGLYFTFLETYNLFLLYGFICFFTVDEIKYKKRFSRFFKISESDDGSNNIFAYFTKTIVSLNIANRQEKKYNYSYFTFKNYFSEAKFNRDIKLKKKIIKKNSTFSVVDLEVFNINYIPN